MVINQTARFGQWLSKLTDIRAKARILTRIDRLKAGNPGDHRNLKGGVTELRIDYGAGYRVYYTRRGDMLIILLCGGDKTTQNADIKAARDLAEDIHKSAEDSDGG